MVPGSQDQDKIERRDLLLGLLCFEVQCTLESDLKIEPERIEVATIEKLTSELVKYSAEMTGSERRKLLRNIAVKAMRMVLQTDVERIKGESTP